MAVESFSGKYSLDSLALFHYAGFSCVAICSFCLHCRGCSGVLEVFLYIKLEV